MRTTTIGVLIGFIFGTHCLADSLKQPVQGLVNMGDITFYNKQYLPNPPLPNNSLNNLYTNSTGENTQGIFAGTVINVMWSQLQPNGLDTPLVTQAIEDVLTAIGTYNKANPGTPITAKLRVWAGFAAPTWAKNINGANTAIQIQAGKQGGNISQTGTVGPWWQENYLQAWTNFQSALAEIYDTNPLIREISVTSCASSTDEPFIAWSNATLDSNAISALIAAGYTDEAQVNCLQNATGHYAGWTNTPLDFPISPFFPLQTNSGYTSPDMTITYGVLQQCAEMNGKCIMSNQGLSSDPNTNLAAVFTQMNVMLQQYPDSYTDFQTVSPAVLASDSNDGWCQLIQAGMSYHAQSIELWPSVANLQGFNSLTLAQLTNLEWLFQGNASYTPTNCPAPQAMVALLANKNH